MELLADIQGNYPKLFNFKRKKICHPKLNEGQPLFGRRRLREPKSEALTTRALSKEIRFFSNTTERKKSNQKALFSR